MFFVDKQLQNVFQSLEQGPTSVESASRHESLIEPPSQPPEADLLARTAGLLLESVEHERNPKFTNSQFLGLMKQLRDREAIVEGNDIVAALPQTGEVNIVSIDLKGKGKAVPSFSTTMQESGTSQLQPHSSLVRSTEQVAPDGLEEDANEAYFRQDNEDYANYWRAHHAPVPPLVSPAPSQEWQKLQRDWERFEATTTGVRPLAKYQFQPGNPYLLGERSHNHTMHGGSVQLSSEVCGFYFVL